MISALGWIICMTVGLLPAEFPAIVRPADIEAAMARRQEALRQAMQRAVVPLWNMDFEHAALGMLGAGQHGEQVLDGRLILGYVGSPVQRRPGVFDLAVIQAKSNRLLALTDRQAGASLYARAPIEESAGSLRFELTFAQVGPMTITIDLNQVVVVVPSQHDWNQWFPNRPYQAKFVYLEGPDVAGDAEPRRQLKPMALGGAIVAGRTYRMAIQWDNARRQANVWIDDRHVVRQARYLSKGEPLSSFVAWRTGSYSNGGINSDPVEMLVDQIELVGERWRLPARDEHP